MLRAGVDPIGSTITYAPGDNLPDLAGCNDAREVLRRMCAPEVQAALVDGRASIVRWFQIVSPNIEELIK